MCKCCDEIDFWENKAIRSDYIEDKMFTRLSIYSWRKGIRKIKQNADGVITSKDFDLNYCPMCGRKLGGIKPNE